MKPTIVFTTLAINQSKFFAGIGLELKKVGYDVAIISFHELSDEYLKSTGLKHFNVFQIIRDLKLDNYDQRFERA